MLQDCSECDRLWAAYVQVRREHVALVSRICAWSLGRRRQWPQHRGEKPQSVRLGHGCPHPTKT
jgi:hypothetical protein